MNPHVSTTMRHLVAPTLGLAVLVAFAVLAFAILAFVLPGRSYAGTSTPPPTWPVAGDVPFRTLTWPVAGDAPLAVSLRWPVRGDRVEIDVPVYFCRCDGVEPVNRRVDVLDFCCGSLLERLFDGPTAVEQYVGYASALPAGTQVASVVVDGGVAYLDLIGPVVSAADLSRDALGQIVYTATEFPGVEAVVVEIQGRVVHSVEGEDLPLGGLITRGAWASM